MRGAAVPVETIPYKILHNGERWSDRPAYHVREDDAWRTSTWGEYASGVRAAARGLLALGVEPGDAVAILGFNRPEWVRMDVAAMAIGAVPAGIYSTNSPPACQYIINHAEAAVVLVEDEEQFAKIVAIRDEIPSVRKVILMQGADVSDPLAMSWFDFIAAGENVAAAAVDERLEALTLDDLGTLIYTSGTTGPPKAVMLSHGNLAWTAKTGAEAFDLHEGDSNVSYLPLSHIAEQMFTIHIPATVGSSVYYAESIDMLAENIKQARPTVFAGVPRVWEKFHVGVLSALQKTTGVKAKIADWAVSVGRKANAVRNRGSEPSGLLAAQEKIADKLVLSKVRHELGLDQGRVFVTAAAPISSEVLEFFSAFFVINEVYGQSEDNGPTTMTLPGRTKFGSVGIPYPGTEVKIAEDDEIVVRGPHVFMGYYKDEAATAEAIVDGWLHSGDLGEFDQDGYLWITGRKKDIIITAGGKNIAPSHLESGIKDSLLVSEAVVIGDRRKYLTALVTLEDDTVGPFMAEHGLAGPAHEAPEIVAEVQRTVDEVNSHVARVEQIKKFTILARQLSIDGGELTPTLKVKRDKVAEHFGAEIEAMYAD
jgi:long-chain acyl-CoA synthetase